MPVYGSPSSPVNLSPGDLSLPMVGTYAPGNFGGPYSGEVVATGYKSIAVARGIAPTRTDSPTTFQLVWTSAPTASSIVQGANEDVDAAYELLYTSSTQLDTYTDNGAWAFYRVLVSSYTAGGALIVLAKR